MLTYVSFLITNIAIYAMLGLGLNLQWGFTGLINFGVAGFVAVGAYATVVLSMTGLPLFVSMVAGGLVAAIFGLGLGIATLRLREDYLAIVTIGAAELVRLVVNNESLVDGKPGAIGINGFPLPLANFRPDIFTRYGMVLMLTGVFGLALWKLGHWCRRRLVSVRESKNKVWLTAVTVVGALVLVRADVVTTIAMLNFKDNQVVNGLLFCSVLMAALVFLLVETLVRSPWGRVLKAIREDEEVAKALGKNVFSYKLQSLMIGGFITGIAGAFYAWQQSNVYPDNFKSDLTFNVWILMVLGGAGSNPGVAIGAAIFWIYTTLTRDLSKLLPMVPTSQIDAFRMVFIGLLLIGLMVWRPQGLLGNRDELTLGK
ncbi:MAG: branched-chain amino acid ABC transporter permease [Cyanobacteria bacterium]|nr:branched-chain amino acid ABC transporter permease [Cyanobacteriota bacterium]